VWRQLIAATPWGRQPGYLLRDRDACYGRTFMERAAKLGIETILTPVHAPKANAIAERVVGTLRRECLDHMIIVNEQHLRRVLAEYVRHYNRARPHRSLALAAPEGLGQRVVPPPVCRVVGRPILGGLHHEYEWKAA
jgi:putative transposase